MMDTHVYLGFAWSEFYNNFNIYHKSPETPSYILVYTLKLTYSFLNARKITNEYKLLMVNSNRKKNHVQVNYPHFKVKLTSIDNGKVSCYLNHFKNAVNCLFI